LILYNSAAGILSNLGSKRFDRTFQHQAGSSAEGYHQTGIETVSRLIQVCYNMTLEDTREREIRALQKAMQHFDLDQGIILTLNQEETIICFA